MGNKTDRKEEKIKRNMDEWCKEGCDYPWTDRR